MAELAAWWDGPGEVGEWRAGEWPAGAALTAARDGVRRRHYLHLSGDLIARHWVYAMAPASLGGGNSGAELERVTLPDGTPGIAKRVVPGGDWLGRAAGGRAITAELWQAGVLQRLPAAIETGIVAVEPEGDGWRILMRDLSAALAARRGADQPRAPPRGHGGGGRAARRLPRRALRRRDHARAPPGASARRPSPRPSATAAT